MKKVPENVLLVIKAIIPLSVIILLFIVMAQIGLGKIGQIRGEISQARQDKAILAEKLDLLRAVAATGVIDSNIVTNSLPESNPSLITMSQLKNLAASNNLILKSLKSASNTTADSDINTVSVGFTILGEKSAMEKFLTDLKSFAPITVLDSVKITPQGTNYLGAIIVKTYWAPLPTQLPTNVEGFQELSEQEKAVLSQLSTLVQPQFITLPPPAADSLLDPFVK